MYLPISGLAHTDAAAIKATVLPVEESTPHKWTKNGSTPSGLTSTLAKLAASTMRAAYPSRRKALAAVFQVL